MRERGRASCVWNQSDAFVPTSWSTSAGFGPKVEWERKRIVLSGDWNTLSLEGVGVGVGVGAGVGVGTGVGVGVPPTPPVTPLSSPPPPPPLQDVIARASAAVPAKRSDLRLPATDTVIFVHQSPRAFALVMSVG